MAGAPVYAAATSTTVTVTNATYNAATSTVSGPVTLTNIGTGTFSSTVALGANITGNYTITLSGGTILGVISLPATVLTGSGTGSMTVTGGTASYAGATGSFPSITGSGSLGSSGTISLSFTGAGSITVGGGGTTTPTPTITDVLDAGSYTASIAQGSIFVVKGTNLSASGLVQFGFPLPSACTSALCSGASSGQITFTPAAGGAAVQAYLVYLYNQSGVNQLAAILPSTIATGNYNVTVTNNTGAVSAPFAVTVVARKIGLITQDGSGSGLVVVQNYVSASELDVNRFTSGSVSGVTISPAHPGQTLIAWATGMGGVSGGDNTASPGYNFEANGVNVQVIVGGVSITPLYAGRAPGLAGADQINFVLPANVPTGCTVPFQVSVNGSLSNPTFIAIAPDATSSACALPGFTTSQLQNLDNGGSITSGGFDVVQFSISENVPGAGQSTVKFDSAGGSFTRFTGFQIAGYQNLASPSGQCIVTSSSTSTTNVALASGTNLDAGAVALTGPSGSGISNLALQEDTTNAYSVNIGTEGISIPGLQNNGTVIAGQYTLKGNGGKDVGSFNATTTLGTPLAVTGGVPSTVTRANGMTLNWTGGNAGDLVLIAGSSTGSTGPSVSFTCTTTAGKGTFTVPASVLNQLPVSAVSSGGPSGYVFVESGTSPTNNNGTFTAPLTAGGNVNAYFVGLVGTGGQVTYN